MSGQSLTGEADLHEVERVQREVGQDPAAHTSYQVLVSDVAEYRAPRRRPGRRLALAGHRLRARRYHGAQGRGGGTRCSGRHSGDGRCPGAGTAGREPTSGTGEKPPTAGSQEPSRETPVQRGVKGHGRTSRRCRACWRRVARLHLVPALPLRLKQRA